MEKLKHLESLDYRPANNGPNENLLIISKVQNFSSLITKLLAELQPTEDPKKPNHKNNQKTAKDQAIEAIDLFERVDIYNLRKAFE